jgi:tetratricopeptide (TPR) repeat protein
MGKIIKTIALFLFIITGQITLGQTNQEKAHEKGEKAVQLEDEGKFDEAIKLLEDAQKLDPNEIGYPYEIGYSYYSKKDYKKAAKYLEKILNDPKTDEHVFQLLGNCYDLMGKTEKALETYDAGLKKLPRSGRLFLEKGNVYFIQKDYNKAISFYEQGIKSDPQFPSNYYRATQIYCSSTEEVWGMIYGEIFMNLERNSERTSEISKLLYNTYKSEIKFINDTSFSVSFSKNSSMNIEDSQNPSKNKLPFGIGIYEPTLILSMINEKGIDINSLDRIRNKFVVEYFKNENNTKYPNILFDYQNQILKAGHLEAYNHWILMKGDEDGFNKWYIENTVKWENFINWFTDNGLKIDNSNKFFSGQY